jgi:tetratricopeptide (TPR) repeat protein
MGKARLSATLIRNDLVDNIPNLPCEDGAVETEEALQQIYRQVYREAIAIAPEHSLAKAARMGLAESFSATGHSRDAIAEYKPLVLETDAHPWKADAGKKFDAEIRTLINEYTEQGNDLRIVELYYQYRSVLSFVEEQQDDDIQAQVAASLQRVGLLHSAMEVYLEAGDTDKVSTRDVQADQAPDPTDGEAKVELLALSDRLYRSKDFEAALRSYRRLLDRKGEKNMSMLEGDDRDWVEYRVGRCLTSLDRVAEATKAFRQLIDRGTGSHVATLAAAHLARLELQS